MNEIWEEKGKSPKVVSQSFMRPEVQSIQYFRWKKAKRLEKSLKNETFWVTVMFFMYLSKTQKFQFLLLLYILTLFLPFFLYSWATTVFCSSVLYCLHDIKLPLTLMLKTFGMIKTVEEIQRWINACTHWKYSHGYTHKHTLHLNYSCNF